MPDLDIESQLLLYIAGELPEAERARLEGLLGRDAALRGRLESLSAAMECADSAMHAADEADPIVASRFDAAARQTSRVINQWQADRLSRKYLVEADVIGVLEPELAAAGIEHAPIDPDDLYSKYEAASPDWFWIEH